MPDVIHPATNEPIALAPSLAMSTAITPEVMGLETQILEESPMTEQEEKELEIAKTAIKTAYVDKLERDLAIGAGLLQIFRRKLYRGPGGGRNWEQWLAEESAELTAGSGALDRHDASRLRGFYQFRCEVLQERAPGREAIQLPTAAKQVRPLLGQLDTHPDAALEMWKAACAQAGRGKVPTFDQVNRAALAYKANEANEARRLSVASRPEAPARSAPASAPKPARDYSPQPTAPTIPAWELEKGDSALDAGTECKRITLAINDARKAIGLLRGILYSQINKHGRDYLGVLRQVDAGVYSLHNIDDQIQQMGEDIAFISELLIADVGDGQLAMASCKTWNPVDALQLEPWPRSGKPAVVSGVSPEAKSFSEEILGPMAGAWDGYMQLDEKTSKTLCGKVGYIHGLSAGAGRQIITIGQTLLEMKELLPHGQFLACVKAEFKWNRQWAGQLMQIAERFSNTNSSSDLPSSHKVLALLADAAVHLATDPSRSSWNHGHRGEASPCFDAV